MGAPCSVDGCDRAAVARGWCAKHWARWKRNGSPDAVQVIRGDDEARFWSKVEKAGDEGCWTWTAARTRDGHGRFRTPTSHVLAHRWSYERLVGPIPEGLVLDHLCRNPPCVNPAHLEPVTAEENVARGTGPSAANAAKTHCPRGHEYSEANTRRRNGRRHCRACDADRPR